MKVSDYLPNLYNNNLEMLNIINSEEDELENNLKPSVDNVFADTFPIAATEQGILEYEEMLGIHYNPETEDLKFRRERIINRLVSSIPFSEKFLVNRLNELLGEGNWSYTLNYNTYSLTINSLIPGKNWYLEVLDFLNAVIPCNIDWELIIYSAAWNAVKNKFRTWNDIKTMTWNEVKAGEWEL